MTDASTVTMSPTVVAAPPTHQFQLYDLAQVEVVPFGTAQPAAPFTHTPTPDGHDG